MTAKALVVMSTWNGIRYLPAQLDSVLAQTIDGDLSILIRDDGSSDATLAYLAELDAPNVRVVTGDNIGPRASFFELLRLALAEDVDFVALCDQDDVWRPRKLARAIGMLGGDRPALYASSLDLVDDELRPIATYGHPGDRSFAATLLGNFVTGCTCVVNRAFLRALPFPERSDRVIMHDWWLASVASVEARIVYDDLSLIQYRQHAANHVGLRTGIAKVLAKLRSARARPAVSRFDHARELKAALGDRLSDAQRGTMAAFLRGEHSLWQRLRFVATRRTGIGPARALWFVAYG